MGPPTKEKTEGFGSYFESIFFDCRVSYSNSATMVSFARLMLENS